MKILLDARLYGLENTGIGWYIQNLVTELVKIDKKNNYSIVLNDKYFNQLNLPSNWKKIKANYKHYSIEEQFKLPELIKKENVDVVHFPHFNVPIFYHSPFVVTIHDLLMHYQKGFEATTLSPIKYLVKRLGYRHVFNSAVKNSIKIIVPSNYVKEDLLNNYSINKDKISVIYEGANKPTPVSDPKAILTKYGLNESYLFYPGNAYPHKNLQLVIKAISEINKNSDKKIYFAIACARNVFIQKIEKIIEKEKAQKYVKLLGFVSEEEKGVLYKHSLAFVFPTLSEGFGIPGIEAMLAGTICLSSDIPVLREVLGDAAIFFNPHDVNSLITEIQKVTNLTSVKRNELISKGRTFASKYSWSKMAEQTLNIYESCNSLRQGQ